MSNLIKVNIDTIPFKSKPKADDVRSISTRLGYDRNCIREMTWEQFISMVCNGHSFLMNYFQNHTGRKTSDYTAQYMVWADIDNNKEDVPHMSPDDCADILHSRGLKPACVYFSFSDKPEHHKFRIGCRFDREINDIEISKKITEAFVSLFNQADIAAVDTARLFYGTTNINEVYVSDNTINPYDLIPIWEERCDKPNPAAANYRVHEVTGDIDLSKAYDEFDFLGWIQNEVPGHYKECGSGWYMLMGECPICGHNDCFTVTENRFQCKSDSSNKFSGNIFNYLSYTTGDTDDQVREYIKYELLGDSPEQEKERFKEQKSIERMENLVNSGIISEVNDRVPYIINEINSKGVEKEKISPQLLYQHIKNNCNYFFVRDNAKGGVMKYWYINGYYRLIDDIQLKGVIKMYIENYNVMLCTLQAINETYGLLVNDVQFHDSKDLNSDETIINFQNGVLNLNTFELMPHDSKYLCTTQIPCDWTTESIDTPVFDKYIDTLINGNEKVKNLLLEYMGIIISNVKGWRTKKALFMVGPGDSGKSQILNLIQMLIGQGNFSSVDLGELESRFGTSQIYNKRLAGSADMSYLSINELKIFKKVTGGDNLFAEFKGENGFQFRFDGLLWFCCNRLPKFGGDNGQWVYNRMLVIQTCAGIARELQDRHLIDKLFAEREGIIQKLVVALNNLIERDYNFETIESMDSSVDDWQINNNTVYSFYQDCCEDREIKLDSFVVKDKVSLTVMYSFYNQWCKDNNRGYSVTAKEFKEQICALCELKEPIKRTKIAMFLFCTLNIECYSEYKNKCNFTDNELDRLVSNEEILEQISKDKR